MKWLKWIDNGKGKCKSNNELIAMCHALGTSFLVEKHPSIISYINDQLPLICQIKS